MKNSTWRRYRGLMITFGIAVAVGLVVFVVAVAASTYVQGGDDDPNGFVTFSICGNNPGTLPQLALTVDLVGDHQYKTYSQEACNTTVLLPKAGLHLWVKRAGKQMKVWWSAPIKVKWSTIEVSYGDGTTDKVTLTSGQTMFSFQLPINDAVSNITVRGLGPGLPPAVVTVGGRYPLPPTS